jgi:single-strand DNA-binding protein
MRGLTRITLIGNLAEIAGRCLQKGSPVYLEAKLKTRSHEDREGNKK